MRFVAIIQARTGSTRLPNKVLKKIREKTVIEIITERLAFSKLLDGIVVATTDNPLDDGLCDLLSSKSIPFFRGSEKDVLERYYQAALEFNAEVIIRITGDCPLIDSEVVDSVIRKFIDEKVDYCSNINPPTFPDGLDTEVISFKLLEKINSLVTDDYDREHVTTYIRNSKRFSTSVITNNIDLSNLRWTLDEVDDFKVIERIYSKFPNSYFFGWKDVLSLYETNKEIFLANQYIVNNSGARMGTGQKLYSRAKKIIPGGSMLLSKRPEMFLPDNWPAYFKKAKGCEVWDLDDKKYYDTSIMGVGTNILGYANDEVNEAVTKALRDGVSSTFNCPDEVFLAEKLIDMHPWADMARFARSGGEINSVAVRIARAHTKKDKIAICGYHGWHDWYLSTNINNKSGLNKHLLPGLEPLGVPKSLEGSVIPFEYNKFEQLEEIIKNNKNKIAAIKMEVVRNFEPQNGFLEAVREIATENNIILIFDECTSGFRETFGGIHKKYKVYPDMAIFGKALGNGFAISACIGKRDVMESTQKTFISSTFWTEKVGPAAALKTLEIMERMKSWEIITNKGKFIASEWSRIAQENNLDINLSGIPSLKSFSISLDNWLAYKTFITQEMLKEGFLASNLLYSSVSHEDIIIKNYIKKLNQIFNQIRTINDKGDIMNFLDGGVCHGGFQRLN